MSTFTSQALDLAESGRFEEAIALCRRTVEQADPEVYDFWQIRGVFASVLALAGDLNGALEQHQLSINEDLRKGQGEDSLSVGVTRYFMGELLLEMGKPEEALRAIQPALHPSPLEGVVRSVEARAYQLEGRVAESYATAVRAVECAASPEQSQRITEQLREILEQGRTSQPT